MGASAGARSPGTAATEAAKLQTAPSPPARRPPGRLMGAHSRPARLPFPNAGGGTAGAGAFGSGPGRGTRAAARPARPALSSSPFCLARFYWFSPPNRKPDSPAPGAGAGGEGSVTRTALLCAACPPGKALSLPLPLRSPTPGCGFRSRRRALRNQA